VGIEIIITHCGKLGDFLFCLPVASWLHKERDTLIHWVLPRCFKPFNYITPLLEKQIFTSKVTLVEYPVDNYNLGGQPYKFNPVDYGIPGLYLNFGFRGAPDQYVSGYFAAEHGLDYDRDFVLDISPVSPMPMENKFRSTEPKMAQYAPHAQPLPQYADLLNLARLMMIASEVHLWFGGLAILCNMAKIPAYVHGFPGHAHTPFYFENYEPYLTFVEHI